MKKLTLVFFTFLFTIFSCKMERGVAVDLDLQEERTNVDGLLPLNDNWQHDSSFYWTYVLPDSSWTKISLKDTTDKLNYQITKVYRLQFGDSLNITKHLRWEPNNMVLLKETDVYEKLLTNFLQVRLRISYDYLNNTYHADLLDTVATDKKLKANRVKLDSMIIYAKENNAYLCGTAAQEILWEDVPLLSVPKQIEKEEALKVAQAWMKE